MKLCAREKCTNYIIYPIVVNIVGKESIIPLFAVMVYDCTRKKKKQNIKFILETEQLLF